MTLAEVKQQLRSQLGYARSAATRNGNHGLLFVSRQLLEATLRFLEQVPPPEAREKRYDDVRCGICGVAFIGDDGDACHEALSPGCPGKPYRPGDDP